jgi:hypothetical protein
VNGTVSGYCPYVNYYVCGGGGNRLRKRRESLRLVKRLVSKEELCAMELGTHKLVKQGHAIV